MGRTRPTTKSPAERPRQLIEAEKSGRFTHLAIELYELLLLGSGATVAGIASKENLRNLRFVRPRTRDPDYDYTNVAAAVRAALIHETDELNNKLRQRDKSDADFGEALRVLLALEPGQETWSLTERRAWAASELDRTVRSLTKTRYPRKSGNYAEYTPSYELTLIHALAERIAARELAFVMNATSELLSDHPTANPPWAPPWFVAVAEIAELIDQIELHLHCAVAQYGTIKPPMSPLQWAPTVEIAQASPGITLFLFGLFWSRVEPPGNVQPLAQLDKQLFSTPTKERIVSNDNARYLPWRVASIMPFSNVEIEHLATLAQATQVTDIPLHPDAFTPYNLGFNLDHFGKLIDRWREWIGTIVHAVGRDCHCAMCDLFVSLWHYRAFLDEQWGRVRDSYMDNRMSFSGFKRGAYYSECGLRRPPALLTVTDLRTKM